MKILGAPHNYFQLLVLAVGYMKNLAASVFSDLTFPAFPSFFQISKIFQLMVQLFQPPQLLQLQLFQLFSAALTYRHRCGRTSRYGLVMELCAIGKIWKPWYAWMNYQILDELSNSGKKNYQILERLENKNLDYVSLKNKKRVNKIHSTSSV